MTLTRTLTLTGLFCATFLTALLIFSVHSKVTAEVNFSEPTQEDEYQTFVFFHGGGSSNLATTTTATSTNDIGGGKLTIDGAKKVTLFLSRGGSLGPNTGSTNFRVQVTPNGTDWYYFNKLVQNLATSTTPTTLSDVTIGAATSTVIVSLNLSADTFKQMRVIAVETTDGEHAATAAVEF